MERSSIDLNADAGESYGAWPMGRDEELFPLVSSVNLACGFHAGDPSTMRASVRLALRHGVAVGAHPGFPDLVGFGRREMTIRGEEIYADVLYQIAALAGFVRAEGRTLHHVKAHGALYMQMADDEEVCRAVAAAVRAYADDLPLVVLAGSAMRKWAQAEGVVTIAEGFPDRGYLATGVLAPRSLPGSLVKEPELAAARAVRMAIGEPVETVDANQVAVEAETLCIHGDNPESVEIARAVREALEAAGIRIAAY